MAFPTNPSPGDSYTDEYGTVWVYAGAVNGWYRKTVIPGNETEYTSADLYNPGGGAVGEVLTKTADGHEWADGVHITSAGLVGIGISSPGDKLHVVGTGTSVGSGSIVSRFMDATNFKGIFLGYDADEIGGSIYGANFVSFQTFNGTSWGERARIDTSGRLGIGTTSPAQKLTVSTGTDSDAGNIQIGLGSVTAGATRQAVITKNTTSPFELTLKSSSGGTAAPVIFEISGTQEAVRIDSSGRLLVGTSTSRSTAIGDPKLQVEGTTYGGSSIQMICNSAADATTCSHLAFGRSKTSSIGGTGQVVNGDRLGAISWNGAQNSTLSSIAGLIECYVDGEVQTGGDTTDMPGRLVFSTTADGASSPTERMRIKANGTINFSNVAVYADNAAAITGGLVAGDVYRTATGQLMITY